MIFSSPRFLVFLVALLALLAAPWSNERKKQILALASCLFYAAWDYRYLALLLGVSVVDYWCAARISASDEPPRRRFYLLVSVVSNLGLLAYFKYTNFFLENVGALLSPMGVRIPRLDILLPAGISFYTFKTMSYTIDVYRGHIAPCRSWLSYATFITFFPELIAGPIVRASVFLPQMDRPVGPTVGRLRVGGSAFLLGLAKKLLIADPLAEVVDPIFASPGSYDSVAIWMGVLAYAGQIYCDFSGYSDMAIGTAKMLGYDLPENFAMPYLSRDIAEFWRRWHITLSTWLRDYLYIPLGGNRGSSARTYVNLAATMVLGGLWHGASWNFILWGALHGGLLAAHRAVRGALGKRWVMPDALSIPLTFLFVVVCWVPFRAATFGATATILARMAWPHDGAHFRPLHVPVCLGLAAAGHLVGSRLARPDLRPRIEALLARLDAAVVQNPISSWYVVLGFTRLPSLALALTVLLLIFCFATVNTSPFIYFQF